MVKRIAALVFIFGSTSIAWLILGGTIDARTSSLEGRLKGRVASLWGGPQEQVAPSACLGGTQAAPVSSQLRVGLDLDYRQKGLLWYSTYKVAFSGDYSFVNDSSAPRRAVITFTLPSATAVYDDLAVQVNGQPAAYESSGADLTVARELAAGEAVRVRFAYRSLGLDRWRYRFAKEVARVRDFELIASTNFAGLDFEDNTLPPSARRAAGSGRQLEWRYQNLLTGSQIAVDMPDKLQPGPLAGQISFFAPVSLLFFFFVMFLVTTLRGIELHPMNYFFLAAAFFAFHLLLAYLADLVAIHVAFVICSLVSVFLVVSYLRLVVGMRFAAVEAGSAQFVYLVLFSYAFFFRGYTGLAITIGAIVTLFLAMQLTGRIRWSERFRIS